MSTPALSLRHVQRAYCQRQAVADVSLDLNAGRIACLLGPSGCGKSTLLRLIAGLEPVDQGDIHVDGLPVSSRQTHVAPEQRGVGLVFQDFALFPHLNVADNIGFGLTNLRAGDRRAQVRSLLARFHLEHLERAWPHTLSGGEQQRVAIARALARGPSVLLLDEPFSGLDGHLRASVRQSVLDGLRAANAAVLIVTHDPQEAMLCGDDLLLMSEGRTLQAGAPRDCYLRPTSLAAARLLGEVVAVPARTEAGVARTALGDLPAPGLPDGPALAVTRPEHVRIGDTGVEAHVRDVRFGGAIHVVTLGIQRETVTVHVTDEPPAVGAPVHLSLDPEMTRILPN